MAGAGVLDQCLVEQVVVRLGQFDFGDVLVVDPDPFEEGLVDQASLLALGQQVGVLEVIQEFQRDVEVDERCLVRLVEGLCQRSGGGSFLCDPVGLFCEQVVADAIGVVSVEQFSLFSLQPSLRGFGDFQLVRCGRLDVLDVLQELVADALLRLRGQGHLRVVRSDPGFDGCHTVVGLRTGVLLAASADEVVVVGVSPADFGVEEPSVAVRAVDGASQVVVVLPRPLPALAFARQEVLNPLERHEVDERFVAAWVLLAVVLDDTGVVAVAKQSPEPVWLDRLRLGAVLHGPTAQAACLHEAGEVTEGVLASRVEVECLAHERPSLGVHRDRADLSAFDDLRHVQVSESSAAWRAACPRLLQLAVPDLHRVSA